MPCDQFFLNISLSQNYISLRTKYLSNMVLNTDWCRFDIQKNNT